MKLLKCQNILFAALGTFFLIACGESTTSETTISEYQGNLDVIADIAELPKCTSENEGEQIFVKSISAVRVCAGGDWYAVAGTASQVTSCSTEELADGTGIKILCGGDSIGVVLNGKDGSQGLQGERGDQGVQGEKGDKGDIGATGAQGLQGEKGDKGEVGATGAQGVQGEKGETGATGAAGTPGKDGATGAAGTPGKDGTSCTVVTLPDNAGLKVLCGGDSVGVVLNGEKGDKGDKGDKGEQGDVGPAGSGAGSEGSSCNLVNKDCIVHVACGKDTVSLEIYSDDESCKEVVVLDTEAIALNLEGIGGTSQKGPFLTGSEVVAYELLDGRTLQQTGKTFSGKILSDKGDFDIKTVSLASQYATLTAKGYYLNEVTGKPSNSQITLTALTNLRGRAVANINLLTHLENERAQYLVIVNKMTVAAAKKKAEAEVFSLFHIDSKDFVGYSEDLNIGGTSDADAALLAMSILLQGNRSEAELSALLTKISKAIEETGKWNDAAMKLAIADWAMSVDLDGALPVYHENVKSWEFSQRVASFEPYVRNYWAQEYGLGECSSGANSVAANTIATPTYSGANPNVGYICVDSTSEIQGTFRAWRRASEYEMDTYKWTDAEDGAIAFGNVTEKPYLFDVDKWVLTGSVQGILKGCIESREGEVGLADKVYYICRNRVWNEATEYEYDTYGWTAGKDGSIALGDVSKKPYLFDRNQWVKADSIQGTLKGCTESREGEVSNAYKKYYICRNRTWNEATEYEYDTYKWLAAEDGDMKAGTISGKYYIFDGKGLLTDGIAKWRLAKEIETTYGMCKPSIYGKIFSMRGQFEGGFFECQDNGVWEKVKNTLMIDTQKWETSTDGYSQWGDSIGVITEINNSEIPWNRVCYVFDTSAAYSGWRKGNDSDCSLEIMGCTEGIHNMGKVRKGNDGLYYECRDLQWIQIEDIIRFNTDEWNCRPDSNDGEMKIGLVDKAYYVCDEGSWRISSVDEENSCRRDHLCRACTRLGYGNFSEDGDFVCDGSWRTASTAEKMSRKICTSSRNGLFTEDLNFVCEGEKWRSSNCAEKKTRNLCDGSLEIVEECEDLGEFKVDYVCKDRSWRAVKSPFDYSVTAWNARKERYFTQKNLPDATIGEDLEDERDHRVYKTVYINGLRWMAENLRYSDSISTLSLMRESFCIDNDADKCEIGGRFYSWTAAMDIDPKWADALATVMIEKPHRGICPEGWHIPTLEEIRSLGNFNDRGLLENAGQWMAKGFSTGYSETASDKYGFAALSVGSKLNDYEFRPEGAGFWSTEDHGKTVSDFSVDYGIAGICQHYGNPGHCAYKTGGRIIERYGLSVRCVED